MLAIAHQPRYHHRRRFGMAPVVCDGGSNWDETKQSCECPSGTTWNETNRLCETDTGWFDSVKDKVSSWFKSDETAPTSPPTPAPTPAPTPGVTQPPKAVVVQTGDCGPNAIRVPLYDGSGKVRGTACGTNAKPCPSGYTFNAEEQACHQVAWYKNWKVWAGVAGGVAVVSTVAVVAHGRRRAVATPAARR